MCGRYVTRTEAAMEREWALTRPPPLFESYNVAPTRAVPAVRIAANGSECSLLRWGLVPAWAHGVAPKYSTINARIETLTTAPTWRTPWKHARRCILPALGFYEWQVRESGKQPYYIHLTDQVLFGLAGLWDSSAGPDGVIESVAIVTMPANALLEQIHNAGRRMPAILRRDQHAAWLAADNDAAYGCLQQYPAQRMAAHPVSLKVNSPRNDAPALIEPVPARA